MFWIFSCIVLEFVGFKSHLHPSQNPLTDSASDLVRTRDASTSERARAPAGDVITHTCSGVSSLCAPQLSTLRPQRQLRAAKRGGGGRWGLVGAPGRGRVVESATVVFWGGGRRTVLGEAEASSWPKTLQVQGALSGRGRGFEEDLLETPEGRWLLFPV